MALQKGISTFDIYKDISQIQHFPNSPCLCPRRARMVVTLQLFWTPWHAILALLFHLFYGMNLFSFSGLNHTHAHAHTQASFPSLFRSRSFDSVSLKSQQQSLWWWGWNRDSYPLLTPSPLFPRIKAELQASRVHT